MSQYTITKPTPEDTDSLIEMHHQSWLDAYPNDTEGVSRDFIDTYFKKRMKEDDGRKKRAKYIDEARTNPNCYFRIAKDANNKVVGFVNARRGENSRSLGLVYR